MPSSTPSPSAADADQSVANAERHYRVSPDDLPLSCPTPSMALWNAHPRVYLPIAKSGRAQCPYCGAVFTLDD